MKQGLCKEFVEWRRFGPNSSLWYFIYDFIFCAFSDHLVDQLEELLSTASSLLLNLLCFQKTTIMLCLIDHSSIYSSRTV